MTYRTVFNPGDSPVSLGDGSSIGGGEWAPVRTTADGVQEAIRADRLIVIDDPGDDHSDPLQREAQDAINLTRRYAERSDTIKDMDKPALKRAAVKAQLVQEDDDHTKAELEDLLVRWSGEIPKPRSKSTSTATSPKS